METPGKWRQTFKIQFDEKSWRHDLVFIPPYITNEGIASEIDTRDIVMFVTIDGKPDKMYIDKELFNELMNY